jgi:DNA mismatch endonuclease (patch repair protein)
MGVAASYSSGHLTHDSSFNLPIHGIHLLDSLGMNRTPSPQRSRNMAAVRQHGTTPELRVRRALSNLGIRYRTNVRSLPGAPDLANQTTGFAVLVHGCYWHRHSGCRRATMPKSNSAFWKAKLSGNVARDRNVINELKKRRLQPLVIWECETKDDRILKKKLGPILTLTARRRASRKRGQL